MEYAKLRYEVTDNTAIFTFCTPDKLNAMSMQCWEEIGDAFSRAQSDDSVHSILFAGEGKAFCAGFDLEESSDMKEDGAYSHWRTMSLERERMLQLWNTDKPVMAAVQGYCLGGGFELTNLVDLVIAADDAVFGDPAMRYSLMPMPAMQWITGIRYAKENLLLSNYFSAEEAYRIGYANIVVPKEQLMETAMNWAHRLAKLPPETLRLTKRLINKTIDGQGFSEYGDWGWDMFHIVKMMPTAVSQEFNAMVAEKGMKEAMHWLNSRYKVV
ncbi:Enoyl-CoA hydratase/isomerase [Oscillibacter sp. PC13]|uniref:enoyl-CoA hydratase/isomerase family protein n=1 Tax=Oscillibacter sp. PC13 TaxID=1855299 RepID=UPI0008E9CC3F|nr:enoyl-CoA hydratase/isomerase family protein [Oscillibacter sp. PC13]SFQ00340.1 Enoyl-CoA hydratase/isomerase [Oscillibacter sp. PC13]